MLSPILSDLKQYAPMHGVAYGCKLVVTRSTDKDEITDIRVRSLACENSQVPRILGSSLLGCSACKGVANNPQFQQHALQLLAKRDLLQWYGLKMRNAEDLVHS